MRGESGIGGGWIFDILVTGVFFFPAHFLEHSGDGLQEGCLGCGMDWTGLDLLAGYLEHHIRNEKHHQAERVLAR